MDTPSHNIIMAIGSVPSQACQPLICNLELHAEIDLDHKEILNFLHVPPQEVTTPT